MLAWLTTFTLALGAGAVVPIVHEVFRDDNGCQVFLGEIPHPAANDGRQLYWVPAGEQRIYPLWATIRKMHYGVRRIFMRYNGGDVLALLDDRNDLFWMSAPAHLSLAAKREGRVQPAKHTFRRQPASAVMALQERIFADAFTLARQPSLPTPRFILNGSDGSAFVIEGLAETDDFVGLFHVRPDHSARAYALVAARTNLNVPFQFDVMDGRRKFGRIRLPAEWSSPGSYWLDTGEGRVDLVRVAFDYELTLKAEAFRERYFPPSPVDAVKPR